MIGGLVALLVAGVAAGAPPAPAPAAAALGPAQLAGQRRVFGFSGTEPPPALVRRIRRGEAGAVVLFSANVPSPSAARSLVARLQAVPRPPALDVPLLVMIDQEGGLVRRLDGPPTRRASEIGQAGPAAARAAGRATGRFLAGVGVNVDLAPVADVARPGSFLEDTGRAFGQYGLIQSLGQKQYCRDFIGRNVLLIAEAILHFAFVFEHVLAALGE